MPDPTGAEAARRDADVNPRRQPSPKAAPCAGGELALVYFTKKELRMRHLPTGRERMQGRPASSQRAQTYGGEAPMRGAHRTFLRVQYLHL